MSTSRDNVVRLPASYYPALVPSGEYRLNYLRHKLLKRFDRDVLEVWFSLIDYGEHFGAQLVRYYPVQASDKRRSFSARPGSDFVREYANVFGRRPRFGAAPLEAFESCAVIGRVEIVKRDHRQRTIPKALRYSTIRELLRKAEA